MEKIDYVLQSAINELTLQNLVEEDRGDGALSYYGEVCRNGEAVGKFRQRNLEGLVQLDIPDGELSLLQSLCRRYYTKYPAVSEIMTESVECMISELLNFTLAEYYFAPAVILFTTKKTMVFAVNETDGIDSAASAVVQKYNSLDTRVRMFKIPKGGLRLEV